MSSSSSILGAALGGSNPSYLISVSSTVSRCFTLSSLSLIFKLFRSTDGMRRSGNAKSFVN